MGEGVGPIDGLRVGRGVGSGTGGVVGERAEALDVDVGCGGETAVGETVSASSVDQRIPLGGSVGMVEACTVLLR